MKVEFLEVLPEENSAQFYQGLRQHVNQRDTALVIGWAVRPEKGVEQQNEGFTESRVVRRPLCLRLL